MMVGQKRREHFIKEWQNENQTRIKTRKESSRGNSRKSVSSIRGQCRCTKKDCQG